MVIMSDNWSFKDLKKWDDIIVKKAKVYYDIG